MNPVTSQNRRARPSDTGGNALDAPLFSKGVLSVSPLDDAPRYQGLRLLRAKELDELQVGKTKRDLLHRLVLAFRVAHKYPAGIGYKPEDYLGLLAQYADIPPGCPERESIEHLSDPQVYAEVRQAWRMRSSFPPLPPEQLRQVCREIRAALVWRSSFKE